MFDDAATLLGGLGVVGVVLRSVVEACSGASNVMCSFMLPAFCVDSMVLVKDYDCPVLHVSVLAMTCFADATPHLRGFGGAGMVL